MNKRAAVAAPQRVLHQPINLTEFHPDTCMQIPRVEIEDQNGINHACNDPDIITLPAISGTSAEKEEKRLANIADYCTRACQAGEFMANSSTCYPCDTFGSYTLSSRIIRLVFAGLARRMVAQLQMKEIVMNVGMIGIVRQKPVPVHNRGIRCVKINTFMTISG